MSFITYLAYKLQETMEYPNRHLSSMRNPDQAEEIVSSLVEMATKIFRLQATPFCKTSTHLFTNLMI